MDSYTYREVLVRIEAAEKRFPNYGIEVAMLHALLEQNSLLKEVIKKLECVEPCIEDLDEK